MAVTHTWQKANSVVDSKCNHCHLLNQDPLKAQLTTLDSPNWRFGKTSCLCWWDTSPTLGRLVSHSQTLVLRESGYARLREDDSAIRDSTASTCWVLTLNLVWLFELLCMWESETSFSEWRRARYTFFFNACKSLYSHHSGFYEPALSGCGTDWKLGGGWSTCPWCSPDSYAYVYMSNNRGASNLLTTRSLLEV